MENRGISVIITTCRRKKEIFMRAVRSALDQTYQEKEIIIVNDAPEKRPDIEDWVRELSTDQIRVLHNESQRGACYSRNRGLEAASGEFVALLDDDDEWYPQKLEKQVEKMKPGVVLVYCDYAAVSPDFEIKPDRGRAFPEGDVRRELLCSNFIGGCSIPLFRRETAVLCGGFDENFQSSQDYDMWLRVCERGNTAAVREVLSVYYVWNESITGSIDRRLQGWKALLDKYKADYERCADARLHFQGIMIHEAVKHKRCGFALSLLAQTFRGFPHNVFCIWMFIKGILQRILKIY